MGQTKRLSILAAAFVVLAIGGARGAGLDPAVQAKVNARLQTIKGWAADPAIVQAVKQANAATSSEQAGMTQEKWTNLSVLDPFVRAFTRNDAAMVLKSRRTDEVSEAFLSSARGTKVAFLSKPSNWSHKGMAKHEVPMTGKIWQGDVAVDESSGFQQVQVAVPVMDGGKPIGSLVVGLALSKLR